MFYSLRSFFREIWVRRRQVYLKFIVHTTMRERLFVVRQLLNNLNILCKRKFGWCLPFSLGFPTDELRDPLRIFNVGMIEDAMGRMNVQTGDRVPRKINFILPGIDSSFIFGGYIAVFSFMRRLMERGFQVRIILQQRLLTSVEDILREVGPDSAAGWCLRHAEIFDAHAPEVVLRVNRDDVFVGYSWTTARLARTAARRLNRKPFVFFIQEYESIFYEYDTIRALCDETYTFDHFALFNSPQLADYFRARRLGVFRDGGTADGRWLSFRHALADVRAPDVEELRQRRTRKLLLYARPEKHAGRNLFELSILALRRVVRTNRLDRSRWQFVGIGSLDPGWKVELAKHSYLEIVQRMSFQEYCNELAGYDIGVSLMYSPHPSVPPLEMAAAGQVVVTTGFENRSRERMAEISGNIIAAEPGIESVGDAIVEAARRVDDFEARVRNSRFDWPRRWEDSFDNKFVARFMAFCNMS
jgi:hypothetical protein